MTDTLRAAAFLDKGGTRKPTTVAHLGVALAHLDQDGWTADIRTVQRSGDLLCNRHGETVSLSTDGGPERSEH